MYNAKVNVASVVNCDDHVYSHYTRGQTNSEGVYALVTKSVMSDREEVRTHDEVSNMYAARSEGAYTTKLQGHGVNREMEQQGIMAIVNQDGGEVSTSSTREM